MYILFGAASYGFMQEQQLLCSIRRMITHESVGKKYFSSSENNVEPLRQICH